MSRRSTPLRLLCIARERCSGAVDCAGRLAEFGAGALKQRGESAYCALTLPSNCQTSLERCCIASVWKPTRRLLNSAHSVPGPAISTRNCVWSASPRPSMRIASEYRPSVGRNMIAKSVVIGGWMYLDDIR